MHGTWRRRVEEEGMQAAGAEPTPGAPVPPGTGTTTGGTA